MALMKTVELFAKEKPVVQREQQRHQYTSLEYLLAKAIAEIPLDTVFAAVFTTTLKHLCGLRIGWRALTGTFTLMTVAGASLGFAIGALVRLKCQFNNILKPFGPDFFNVYPCFPQRVQLAMWR